MSSKKRTSAAKMANEASEVEANEALSVEDADSEINEAEEKISAEMTETDKQINELTNKVQSAEKQLSEAKDSMLRLQADFDNYRKRNEKLRTDSLSDGKCAVIVELLKSIDNFERALAVECSDEGYASGMQMIHKMMIDALNNMGLEEIDTSGAFDPNLHEAVMQEENPEAESGAILLVLQKGYKFDGKVIRPAMVKVAK